MTNNELAKAVCRGYNYHGKLTPQGVAGFVVDRCTETANKKDQQFKAFLEKIGRGEKWAAFERFMEEK